MILMLAATLLAAMDVTGIHRMLLSLPLCLSIAIVYKTTRCEDLRQVPRSSLVLFVTIVVTMYAIGVGLWLLFRLMA